MRAPRVALALSLCLLVSLVAACGSGGGGGSSTPADASLLSGDHFLWAWAAVDGMPDTGNAAWAIATADGVSTIDGTIGQNVGGGVSGPSMLPTLGYTVAGDRATTITEGMSLGAAGWTRVSGSVTLTGGVLAATDPAVLGLVKLGSGFATADLQGDWFVGIATVDFGGDMGTYWGMATFDAAGFGGLTLTQNIEGLVGPIPPSVATSNVASNGQVTMTIGSAVMEGALDGSKNLLVLTGSTAAMSAPFWMVFVRKTSGASAATFGGTYQIVGLERDGGGFSSLTGSVASNGAGSLSATFIKNTDGVIANAGPEIVSYTAGADGALVVDPMGEPLEGGFSSGGTFAVIAGPNAAMTNPRMYVLMRR